MAAGMTNAWHSSLHSSNIMTRFPVTGCRYRFTPADWQFIIESLGGDSRARAGLASLCRDPESVQQILDHPKLFEAVLIKQGTAVMSQSLFFFVIVRHTLKRIGVDEPEVADYIAVACADFSLAESTSHPMTQSEIPSLYSADYLDALERARGAERFFIHVKCANQFLVLTCLYPSFLHHRAERRGAPDVGYYEGVVINHLQAASHHALANEFALQDVLARLAEAFPPVRRAMNHTLREYLSLGS
jgi:hypothetical protein